MSEGRNSQPKRLDDVKTVRFSKVVQKAGQPETHLVLVEPSKDHALQAAIKTQRVMTVQQTTVGTKSDRGAVGFHPGKSRQFFVFPKSLRAFAGRTVVGIKYEMLGSAAVPQRERVAVSRPPKTVSRKPAKPVQPTKVRPEKPSSPAKSKVIPFKPAPPEDDEDEAIVELKKKVRHAMAVLEEGKPVAAFNLLKRIVGDEN